MNFILLLFLQIVISDPKIWFGFYQDGEYGSFKAGCTLYLASSPERAFTAKQHGMQSLLMTTSLLNYTSGRPVLRNDYKTVWTELAKKAAPLLENKTIIGFDLGDELIWNCFPVDQMEEYSNIVRNSFPTSIIWANEATPVLSEGKSQCGKVSYSIPKALSWFSIDMYHFDGPDKSFVTDKVRKFYDQYIFPQLVSGQQAALVPGSFGSLVNKECDDDCYDKMCQLDAENFVDWALSDDRIAAIIPWHWDYAPTCVKFRDERGTSQDSKLIQKWNELSKKFL